jgi:peptide/nickel transport system substrate-binding protein
LLRPVNRLEKRIVAALGALVLGFAALALAGTGRAGAPDDVLVVGQVAEPRSLDPATVTSTSDFRILVNIYEGLTRFRPGSLEVEPALAERWEILDGGKTYVFHLRKGVSFHDGTPFNADAVKFNFERLLDPRHPSAATGPFPLAFFFSAVKAVEIVGPLTVRFRLDEPFAPLLSNLAYPAGLIVSPKAVTERAKDFGRAPVGTGPFRFASWESERQVKLARFDGYWGDKPQLSALVFRPIADPSARAAEMLSGGLDVMPEVPADDIASFGDRSRFALHEAAGPHLWYLTLNAARGPLRDVRVRRAVNLAIDKHAIVDAVLRGTASVPAGPVPAAFGPASDDRLEPYPHEPAKARALTEEAGAAGATLTLLASDGGSGMLEPIAMATAIQADLAKIGLKVVVRTMEWNAYLARVNNGLGDADMAEMAWMTNDPDTLPFLALRSAATPEKGGFNTGGYSNPELDDLLERARRETDPEARAALYRAVDRIGHNDAPWALVASGRQVAVTTSRVRGFELQPSFLLDLSGVSKQGARGR